jgi:hypothetical protein
LIHFACDPFKRFCPGGEVEEQAIVPISPATLSTFVGHQETSPIYAG